MNDFRSLFNQPAPSLAEGAVAYEGEVVKAPTSLTSTTKVELNHFNDENEPETWEHECNWMPFNGQWPSVGDQVIVITSDEEESWIVGWIPAAIVQAITLLTNVNTTGLTSAQIDSALSQPAANGMLIHDSTNHLLLVREGGKWYKTAVLTQIA